jgi:tetratricopeptide (TPR) repeat protein
MRRPTAIALILALLALPRLVVADDGAAEAKRLYLSGSKHFDLGEYQQALEDFKSAYRVRDEAVLLYNIAQCQRLLGQSEDAVRSYKAYLRRAPTASNRDEVQAKIAALEQALTARDRARAIPPIPPAPPTGTIETHPTETAKPETNAQLTATAPPPHEREPVYKKWWLWTAVGGAVAVGLGVGLGVGLHQSGPATFPAVGL